MSNFMRMSLTVAIVSLNLVTLPVLAGDQKPNEALNKGITKIATGLAGGDSGSHAKNNGLVARPKNVEPGEKIHFVLHCYRSEKPTSFTFVCEPAGYLTLPAKVDLPPYAEKVEFDGARTDKAGDAFINVTVQSSFANKFYPTVMSKAVHCIVPKKK